MKASHLLIVPLCLLFLASPAPAAELILSTEELLPTSTLELRFDEPMIPEDQVGETAKTSPLAIEPPVPGEFKWTSTRGGQFHFTKTPDIGLIYQFALAPKLKDATGKPVPALDLGEHATTPFKIADIERDYPFVYGNSARRDPYYLIQFNDPVDPTNLAKYFYFADKTETQRVPATVRPATFKDFQKHYNPTLVPTWAELAAGTTPVINKDKAKDAPQRDNAIVVTAAEPLPIGDTWTLHIVPAIANVDGNASITPHDPQPWGTVLPLAIKEITTENHFDSPHEVIVTFTKALNRSDLTTDENSARLASFVNITPAVANMSVRANYSRLVIAGDFQLNTPYDVTITEGLPGSDDLTLEAPTKETVTFSASPVFLSTTAESSAQQAHGNGILDIYAANYQNLNIRVKKLSQGELIQARALYNEAYKPHAKPEVATASINDTPFEEFPGTTVYQSDLPNPQPLEKATLHHLKWSDILGETPAAPVFIEMTATPQDGAPAGTIVSRAIVEFTDIGLLLKDNHKETLVYAFSYKTGQPLPNVQLTFMDSDRAFLNHISTDASGIAISPGKNAGWVLARNGDDATAINIDNYETRIGLWGHGINVGWNNPWTPTQQTVLFSDRPVYKPGDTAHLKAITRQRSGDTLSLSKKPLTATLVINDPRNREIVHQPITFSPNGTWSHTLTLPESSVGWYSARIVFPKAEGSEDEPYSAYLDLRVDEYKPNSFEVLVDGANHQVEPDRITIPLSANYYMGKPLSKATVNWSASLDSHYSPPAAWSAYHFGDVAEFWNYGQDTDDETATEEDSENSEDPENWSAYGEIVISDEGKADINLPTVPDHRASLPQTVSLYAEVVDVNQQTITKETQFQLPGADFIIGSRTSSWYATANKPFQFDFVAITPQGTPFTNAVPVEIKIERQQWNTVRVEAAGGAVTTKNQSTLIEEHQSTITLNSVNQQPATAVLDFTPKSGGTYFLTATAVDPKGKTVLSRIAFYTLGGDSYPWSWDEGTRITLQPDKTSVKPGEDITIVVKTPLSGKALVSVERNRVHRHFLADISPANPVITIKAEEIDAPNAFVSVILIRGANASPQTDPMPEYKVGYCEIKVESVQKKLVIDLQPSQNPILPAGELTIAATIKDAAQKPVSNAEVTLYAVDEGVLSLMGYTTPDPFAEFNPEVPLAISNHTTIDALIPESLKSRYRGNKGIIIGGGGDETSADDFLRKNFVATALWQANLITDAEGKLTHTFKVPDNLTRYRIMAVAVHGADRFGSAESSFTINKPLMVEPAVPRFAHRDDELLVKAIVHNTTPHRGQVEVELKLNDTTELITEGRPFILISQKTDRQIAADHRSERRLITLEPNQTTAVSFPVRFTKTGTASWQWSAKTTEWNGDKPLADSMMSTFEVTHPAPALREVHYVTLTSKNGGDLTKKINPQLLEAEGKLRLNLSQSRITEARDALEYVLQYPYGCVEQTTSRVLPWLALSKYEPLFPELLQKDKARTAIQRGVERLLTMQTETGGLAYWPGGETPELWASAYGGFALIKAKEYGIVIPQQSIDQLTTWLSDQLRDLDLANTPEAQPLNDAALALYTLAKAGKPQPAYQTTLYTRRNKLPDTSRAFLALAMCLTDAPAAQISELLKPAPKPKNPWERYWLGDQTVKGLQLIASAHLGLTKQAELLTEDLYKSRKTNGHWGTTFSNAWILLGLSTNERVPKVDEPLTLALTYNGEKADHTLPGYLSTFNLDRDLSKKSPALTIAIPEGKTLRGRLEIQSWPEPKTFQPVSKGFTIRRSYQRLTTSGILEPAENLRVGDMVVTTLEIDVHRANRYLAIEDNLPSVFEPINPEFETQNAKGDAEEVDNEWYTDHRELRHDKALFFTNDWSTLGKFQLKYLARVIAEGDVIAPPAKIEAMYEPDHYALSAINLISTLPSTKENVVKK
ncbi:alpha-2-macroglobulin family protein [Phragmitibacter flavus]|nr:alpha-2-macroglobulin family protein [Phragmitibacter flavus]